MEVTGGEIRVTKWVVEADVGKDVIHIIFFVETVRWCADIALFKKLSGDTRATEAAFTTLILKRRRPTCNRSVETAITRNKSPIIITASGITKTSITLVADPDVIRRAGAFRGVTVLHVEGHRGASNTGSLR